MIYAAADVSGNPEEGNHKFMSIVLITEDHLRSIINYTGLKQIPIGALKQSKVRDALSSKLEFNRKESVVFCLKIERNKTIAKIKKMIDKKHKKTTSHRRIYQKYDYSLFRNMRDEIIDFGKKHNYELSEITFQCDDDCQSFLKQNGLRCNTIEQKNLIRVKNHNNSDTGYDNETYDSA